MIAIGAAERTDELRDRLLSEFQFLQAEGMDVQIKTLTRGEWTFIGCDMVGRRPASPELWRRFRLYVANALSDVILNRWEERFLRKLIRSHYGYLGPEEQETVYGYAYRSLYMPEGRDQTLHYRVKRKGKILARLTEYLDKNNELFLDGFVTFRLKDYVQELEEAVDLAVEEFMLEKEHDEFVRLLRYFVEMQEPRLPAAGVCRGRGGLVLVDGDGRHLKREDLEPLLGEAGQVAMDAEDFVISTLIALAPRALVIHRPVERNKGMVDTLRGIFGSRLTICSGCALCGEAVSQETDGDT